MSFESQIKEWVILDNEIKNENDKLKELRNKKNKLNGEIIKYTIDNNLTNATIEINDSNLKFVKTKTQSSLSLKYIEKCLKNFIEDDNTINKIILHIKENRETKYELEIKRTFIK